MHLHHGALGDDEALRVMVQLEQFTASKQGQHRIVDSKKWVPGMEQWKNSIMQDIVESHCANITSS